MSKKELTARCMERLRDLYSKNSPKWKVGMVLIKSDEKFSSRDLAGKTGLSHGAVQAALAELRKQFRFETNLVVSVPRYTIVGISLDHTERMFGLINQVFRPCELISDELVACQ